MLGFFDLIRANIGITTIVPLPRTSTYLPSQLDWYQDLEWLLSTAGTTLDKLCSLARLFFGSLAEVKDQRYPQVN